jgi:TRAP-type mannitol/chloroaromatic compound transport system permease large subunit
MVFLLAFFLDFFELAFIIIPLLVARGGKLGIDLIWFGVLMGVNMQTSFMHPPFGFALFYLRRSRRRRKLCRQGDGQADGRGDDRRRSTGAPCRSW